MAEFPPEVLRARPLNTSANFHDFLPLPHSRRHSFTNVLFTLNRGLPGTVVRFNVNKTLLSVGKFGQLMTPPPKKIADVLNEWSLRVK